MSGKAILTKRLKKSGRIRRKLRYLNRNSLSHGSILRLSVFRSPRHIYAQIIDDSKGNTLAFASSIEKDFREKYAKFTGLEKASFVGKILAERALAKGINRVYLDRSYYKYHGRIASLADSARKHGMVF